MKKLLLFLVLTQTVASGCSGQDRLEARLNELRDHYTQAEPGWINNEDILGVGLACPKEYSLHLTLDREDPGRMTCHIDNIEAQQYIVPTFNKPAYLIFYMAVASTPEEHYHEVKLNRNDTGWVRDEYYEVWLNREQKGWVHEDEVDFFTWERFLTETAYFGIEPQEGVFTKTPGGEMVETDWAGSNVIARSMEGDWLKVCLLTEEEYESYISEEWAIPDGRPEYWTRWRTDGRLTVKPYLLY